MTAKRPSVARNHHFVPQWVLREWEHKPSYLWVAKRSRGDWRVLRRPTRRSFSQRDLYILLLPDRNRSISDSVEKQLSGIEDQISRYWKQVKDSLEGRRPVLRMSSTFEEAFKDYMRLQLTRTTQFLSDLKVAPNMTTEDIIRCAHTLESHGTTISDEEWTAIRDGSMREHSLQNALAISVVNKDPKSRSRVILDQERILVFGEVQARECLVISDAPVLRCVVPSAHGSDMKLSNPGVQLWTPLSPRFAMGLVHPNDSTSARNIPLPPGKVREWNDALVGQSSMIASVCKRHLQELVSRNGDG